jgi:hypothetical protein
MFVVLLVTTLKKGVLAAGLAFGVRPAKRVGGILLSLPLLSVSILAWITANPFNGALFALAAVALIVIAFRLPNERVQIAPVWAVCAGVIMFAFGWVYPHFLETWPVAAYLYAAPTGLVPCPTLSIVIGLALIVGAFDSRTWASVLGAMGVFYGIFGALRLNVTIDYILLLGALLTLLVVFMPKAHVPAPKLAH